MINTTSLLLSDVTDTKRKVLAKKGERVTVIWISEPAVIVEYKGERFVTNLKNLK